jgi:hypothetical protein
VKHKGQRIGNSQNFEVSIHRPFFFLQVLYLKSKPKALAVQQKKARAESLDKDRVKNKNEVQTKINQKLKFIQ